MKKILHVMHHMARDGGAESWLMHVLRNMDRASFHMDVVVQTEAKGTFDDEIRSLGFEVIRCLGAHRPWRFAANFLSILAQHGPYDVVHSHIHDYSGIVLFLARLAGVPQRIAHSHIDWSPVRKESGVFRKLYSAVTRALIRRCATDGLGCSAPAASDLFGSDWTRDPRWRVLHCGIDLAPYRVSDVRARVAACDLRRDLGIRDGEFVIGHVGRFVHQKNHAFLIDVVAECVKREPSTRLVLVGHGGLRPSIEHAVLARGLTDRVIFAGVRFDVARLMTEVFDVFVMPSRYEGLGLVLVEAQAAGLPCVISDAIPREATTVVPLVSRVSLMDPPGRWAEAVLSVRTKPRPVTRSEAWEMMNRSSFNIRNSVTGLQEAYLGRGRLRV